MDDVKDNVVMLDRRIPVTPTKGEHWSSALDMLKELVNDLEHGRIQTPDLAYVAMQTRHKKDNTLVAYPSYSWGVSVHGLVWAGLLQKHIFSLFK